MIRVTGGIYRSRLLETPKSKETKPTMDAVRVSVFNCLGNETRNAKTLDLFAGSGAYGIEALSRGATHATFVDQGFEAIEAIKTNVSLLKILNAKIIKSDYQNALRTFIKDNVSFDLIFIDPPYKFDKYDDLLNFILDNNLLSENGVIVIESHFSLKFEREKELKIKEYQHGYAKVYLVRK